MIEDAQKYLIFVEIRFVQMLPLLLYNRTAHHICQHVGMLALVLVLMLQGAQAIQSQEQMILQKQHYAKR